jgi:hypothetical protein
MAEKELQEMDQRRLQVPLSGRVEVAGAVFPRPIPFHIFPRHPRIVARLAVVTFLGVGIGFDTP